VATHRDLDDLVKKGAFRQDLYHRIYVFPILLPPLRERSEDIPLLTDYFARSVARQNDWKPLPITEDAYDALRRYTWPGNVRELRNVVERLLLLADGQVDASTVRMALPSDAAVSSGNGPLSDRVDAYEREVIVEELKRHDFKMADTARALGLERSHLYKKCQQLGIERT
jgi:DNA-binding NtrC family response regulator